MKTICIPLTLLLMLAGAVSPSASAQSAAPRDLVDSLDNGVINWTQQYIEVTGFTVINRAKHPNEKVAVELARKGALAVAYANLLEIVSDIQVYRETKVSDLMTSSDEISMKVQGAIRGQRQHGKARVEGDLVTVSVRMPLYGSGLATQVIDGVRTMQQASAAPASTGLPASQTNWKQRTTEAAAERSTTTVEPAAADPQPEFVLNFAGGEKFNPALFPVVMDETGQVIADFSKTYDGLKGDYVKYVQIAGQVARELKFKQGIEVVDAVQNFDGTLRVNTAKHPKFQQLLKKAMNVGKFILPILTLL